jgi:NAD(P)H-dependent FMN reductase
MKNSLRKTDKRLLIISNTPSANTRQLAEAALFGAQHRDIENVLAVHKTPFDAGSDDALQADAILLGTTENFGYMSGALKDFFERIYYPCLEQTQGKPYALYIRAGKDGQGALTSVERIVTGLRWKAVQPAMILHGEFKLEFVEQCRKLGTLMAAGLDADVF